MLKLLQVYKLSSTVISEQSLFCSLSWKNSRHFFFIAFTSKRCNKNLNAWHINDWIQSQILAFTENLQHTLGFTHISYLTCDTDWHVYASERCRHNFCPRQVYSRSLSTKVTFSYIIYELSESHNEFWVLSRTTRIHGTGLKGYSFKYIFCYLSIEVSIHGDSFGSILKIQL